MTCIYSKLSVYCSMKTDFFSCFLCENVLNISLGHCTNVSWRTFDPVEFFVSMINFAVLIELRADAAKTNV